MYEKKRTQPILFSPSHLYFTSLPFSSMLHSPKAFFLIIKILIHDPNIKRDFIFPCLLACWCFVSASLGKETESMWYGEGNGNFFSSDVCKREKEEVSLRYGGKKKVKVVKQNFWNVSPTRANA